ncbi:hypothetical protein LMG3458_04408 [Achromobacter deleyi]|uniref:Uncharacterized protein n=2 Tax=Achromobacter deleyi TaxID=1353891 RepID=A0A6S7AEF4_9BURK|nr:hypothetical protein LMG3458_04408 [Achromobacter deleyi]CAB3866890.1 hypothetical protein LMG3412_02547 [Achromobacter deleyi]CAB3888364.1 hypothetical protein LMG3481_03636 [Achromobacter deleyi]CAB3916135.1 hypothetical protein LMG3482_05108 [Achromobacter deleyi]
MRGSWEFESKGAPGCVTASLGWRDAMGDVKPRQKLAFEGGNTFSVTGVPIARNTAAEVAYDAQFGGGNRQQSGG